MDETWKPIPGYSMYEVSNHGQVRSWYNNKWGRGDKPIILKTPPGKGGYPEVGLSKDGRRRTFDVHVLVLLAFIGPRPANMECCHGDGNPANNSLLNLRWDTRSANVKDAVGHGTHFAPGLRGEAHSQAKLVEAQVIEIRQRYAQKGITQTELGARFGVGQDTVSLIVNNKTWVHIGG